MLNNTSQINDPVLRAIEKYKNHPSILAISKKCEENSFSIKYVSFEEIIKEIGKLEIKKACQDTDIAFDCLLHDLIIAKLHAYGFDMKSLKYLYSYLQERHQKVSQW